MLIGVTHVAPPYDQRMIEQRAVSIGNRLQFLQEIRETGAVVPVDPGEVLPPLGVLAVVGSSVIAGFYARLRIAAETDIARDHQRRDARNVPLEGERLKVEQQLDVLVERLGNAKGDLQRR